MTSTQEHQSRNAFLSWSAELTGLLIAILAATAAVVHISSSARGDLLFFNGDSVLPEIVMQSLREGLALEWVMSPVLFLAPELPVYGIVSLFTSSVKGTFFVTAVVNLVLLYLVLRLIARIFSSNSTRSRQILVAMVPFLFLIGCTFTELSSSANSLELVSLIMTSTYYGGTVLAMGMTLALVAVTARAETLRSRRILVVCSALLLLAVLTTISNPLYLVWVVAPLVCVAGVLGAFRRMRWGNAAVIAFVPAAGAAIGMLIRVPLESFIKTDATSYFRPEAIRKSIEFFADRLSARASVDNGRIELALLALVFAITVVGLIAAIRRSDVSSSTILGFAVMTTVSTIIGAILVGSMASRYISPVFFAPAFALVAVASAHLPKARSTSASSIKLRFNRATVGIAAALAVIAVVTLIGVPTVRRAEAVISAPFEPAECLSAWIDGRDISGAGQFWTIRAMKAYGDDTINLKQIKASLEIHPWLINLADYDDKSLSYVLRDGHSRGFDKLVAKLGEPAALVDCGSFEIYDYGNTPGEQILTAAVDADVKRVRVVQGFGQ